LVSIRDGFTCAIVVSHPTFSGGFCQVALPGSDVLAYTHTLTSKASNGMQTKIEILLVGVLWAGSDQILHQRVSPPKKFWLDKTPIGYLLKTSTLTGVWNGTWFHNSDSSMAYKKIKKIVLFRPLSGWNTGALHRWVFSTVEGQKRGGFGRVCALRR
jgi:hypothetical protein